MGLAVGALGCDVSSWIWETSDIPLQEATTRAFCFTPFPSVITCDGSIIFIKLDFHPLSIGCADPTATTPAQRDGHDPVDVGQHDGNPNSWRGGGAGLRGASRCVGQTEKISYCLSQSCFCCFLRSQFTVLQTDSGGALCAEWGSHKSIEPPGHQKPKHDRTQLCVTRDTRMGCGTVSPVRQSIEPKPTRIANCPLAIPMAQGWATHLSQWLLGQQKGTGLSPLTNTDSSNDWGGNDRQGDPTSNGQVPLVLGGFLPLVPAVDLMEEKAPGEHSSHPGDIKK